MFEIDLQKFNKPTPRYTSYPTAPEWRELPQGHYEEKLIQLGAEASPLSLYLHVPFCKTMCLYCGCSVVLNRKKENEERYVAYLLKELSLVRSYLGSQKKAAQIHFGGGTPTQLSIPLFTHLFEGLAKEFALEGAQEIAIEIDPRTVVEDDGEKLRFLKQLGFNRVSFGVQDTDPKVQEAVKRRQSLEVTEKTFALARSLDFKGINIDLIYGLPYQSVESFQRTVAHILNMRPDRIAFFSYAQVPWLKPHQKAIQHLLPTPEEKFAIYKSARQSFIEAGYLSIGMDHFSLETDELALAYRNKTLQRNFQGYSLKLAENTLGFGNSAIGFAKGSYIQNIKELPAYYEALDQGKLPVHRGKELSGEDHLRKWVIHTLMCKFELDKSEFESLFHKSFDFHFESLSNNLQEHEKEGLLVNMLEKIVITPLGELLIRLVVATFDAYLNKPLSTPQFSQSI